MNAFIAAIFGFVRETRAETRKVVWPTRQFVLAAMVIVLILVALTGLYVMFVDFILGKFIGLVVK